MRVACGSGHGQNLVFLGFQGHNVDFFDISRRSVYVLVRSLRSLRVGGVLRLFKQIPVFFSDSGIFFIFRVFFGDFSHLWLFITKKRLFLAILSDLGIFSPLWLFIMNVRLFITKKRPFLVIYRISAFLVICGFLS